MASDFILPPTGFGPGSQDAGDGELDYMALPSGMRTYSPHIPEAEDPRTVTSAMALLGEASDAARESSQTGLRTEIDLAGAEAAVLALIADTLGEGEVSMKLLGVPALKVQESVFAGVWRLVGAGVDRIEVAPVPGEALARAHAPSRKGTGHETPKSPQVVNAPALLEEILDKSANFQRGQEPHVINLTLLPHTEADLVWLDAALGEGSVTILSRGYGNCRLTATAVPHVWRVQFFNSMDTLILDTFEVTEMPEVALAAPEDLADSASRIREVMGAIA